MGKPGWGALSPSGATQRGLRKGSGGPRVGLGLGGEAAPHQVPPVLEWLGWVTRGFARGGIRCPADDQTPGAGALGGVDTGGGWENGPKSTENRAPTQAQAEGPSLCPFGPPESKRQRLGGKRRPRASACHLCRAFGRPEREERKERVVNRGDSGRTEGSWSSPGRAGASVGDGRGEISQLLDSAPIGDRRQLGAVRHMAG